jgi:hypothetical protein
LVQGQEQGAEPRPLPRDEAGGEGTGKSLPWANGAIEGRVDTSSTRAKGAARGRTGTSSMSDVPTTARGQASLGYVEQLPLPASVSIGSSPSPPSSIGAATQTRSGELEE